MSIKETLHNIKQSFESSKWRERPQSLNIEVTAACDARCIHCPRQEMDRPKTPMNFELFKKVIDEAAEMKIPELCPNGFGELLVLKDLEKYIAYMRSTKHRFRILVNTNGNRFFKEQREIFFKYEVDHVNICLDGATHETMEKVRPKLNAPQIEDNILSFYKEREEKGVKKPQMRLGFVVIPQNEHECQDFLKKWEGKVDKVGLDGFSNRIDSVDEDISIDDDAFKGAKACVLPFNTLNVWANGSCVLCCNDWNEDYVVGNASDMHLRDIWHSQELNKVRQAHFKGCGSDIEICKKCNWWQAPEKSQKLWY
jgi:radical SAM protein with 4Fe4S-binding SPASM domain